MASEHAPDDITIQLSDDMVPVYEQRVVRGAERSLRQFLAANDWTNPALDRLAKRLAYVLQLAVRYGFDVEQLDWNPIREQLAQLRTTLQRREKPTEWQVLETQCSVFAVFEEPTRLQPELSKTIPVGLDAPQVMRFFEDFDLESPTSAQVIFHKEYYPQPPRPQDNWTGDLGTERPLWFRMMAGTYIRGERYTRENTAYHWQVLKDHMDIAAKHGLEDFGILSKHKVATYNLSAEETERIRPEDAVLKSQGIGFHVVEINTRRDKPRELDLVMFPFLEQYVPGRLYFDQYKLLPTNSYWYTEPTHKWEDEHVEEGSRLNLLNIDVIFVALNPVNWDETDEKDFFKFLGLR